MALILRIIFSLVLFERENEMHDIESANQYLVAAESGDVRSQFTLAVMYSNGYGGVDKDFVLAHKWATLAAIDGNAEASMLAELIIHYMSRQEIDRSRQLIQKCRANKF